MMARPASSFLEEAYSELQKCSEKEVNIEDIKEKIQGIATALTLDKNLTFDEAWSNHYDTNIDPYLDEIQRFLSFLEAVKTYKNTDDKSSLEPWDSVWIFSDIIAKILEREPVLF